MPGLNAASSGRDAGSGPAVVPRTSPTSPPCPQAVPSSRCSASPGMLCPGWERTWQHIPWDASTDTLDPVLSWSPLPPTAARQTRQEPGRQAEPGWCQQLPPAAGARLRKEFPQDGELERLRQVLPAHPARIRPHAQVELPSHVPGRCRHLQRCWEAPGALPALSFTAEGPDSSLGEMAQAGTGGTCEQEAARWHRLRHSGRGGSGKGVGPFPCATGRAGMTTPYPATAGTCRAGAWPCPGHGAPAPAGCLRPAPHLPSPPAQLRARPPATGSIPCPATGSEDTQ